MRLKQKAKTKYPDLLLNQSHWDLGGPTYALEMSPFSPLLGLHTCKNQIPRIVDSKTDVDPTSCELFLPFMCTCRIFLSSPTLKFQFLFSFTSLFCICFRLFLAKLVLTSCVKIGTMMLKVSGKKGWRTFTGSITLTKPSTL